MSKELWDSRYSEEVYIYGTEPNEYLKQVLARLRPGSILFPAEGEGRNAVYAASLGWNAEAFDQSEAGREKATKLAHQKGVTLQYSISSLEDWQPSGKKYDCIALLYVHLTPELRMPVHQKLISALNPEGYIILEAFTKKQMPRTSGGPKNLDLLFDANELREDFKALEVIEFAETVTILDEGPLHQGMADVVRITARKK